MLTLPSLFADLCADPSNPGLLSQLLTYQEHGASFGPYYAREDTACRQALTEIFSRRSVPLRKFTRLAAAQVCVRHHLNDETPITAALLAALADDPLCLLILSEALNTHIGFERVCTRLRRACLGPVAVGAVTEPLLAALALQAWNNEYLWEQTAEEEEQVAALPAFIDGLCEAGDLPAATLPLLRWAMYRPLGALPAAEALATRPLAAVSPVLHPLWRHTLLAPREEVELRDAAPAFAAISDPTSRAVRAQYEGNPYPRWHGLGGPNLSLLEHNRALDPTFTWPPTFRAPLQVLVAGCGTGKHPLSVAAANPSAEVFALDLSAASLAYARRKARELGVDNVRFYQGDLLELPAWGRRFHHIECVGVLHHLRDQQAGWQAVTDVLHPGGTLSVGVYSKVARLPVTHLRTRIAAAGLAPTPAAVRAFRGRLLREPDSASLLAPLLASYDFYSLSMVRDLLFHVHEHLYTLTELEQRARACGLRLLGYRLPRSVSRALSRPAGPATFAQWRALEMSYTGSLGMFLCTLCRANGNDPA